MSIWFSDMIKQSKSIVIGTYEGYNGSTAYESDKYYFNVIESLKGDEQPGKITLDRAHGCVHVAVGTYCIAFINHKNQFEWVGTSKEVKEDLDQTLLFLEGFYDFNAYIVAPAMITIGQLKEYIKNDSFSGSANGNVYFFSNAAKKMEASPIQLKVDYVYKNNELTSNVTINGIELNDFKSKPLFNLPFWDDILTVEYEPNLYRPLQFNGKIVNSTSASSLDIMFWLEEPEELTLDEFKDFMGNKRNGDAYYELELVTDDNKKYTIILSDDSGEGSRMLNYNGKTLDIYGIGMAPERYITFNQYPNEYKLLLDSATVPKEVYEYAGDDLVRELKMGNIICQLVKKGNGEDQLLNKCILSYKSTKFHLNAN